MSNIIERALNFAYSVHSGQYRKDGVTPYIVHPIEVMRLLQACGCQDPVILAAALLHDVVEDTDVSIYTIKDEFGERIEYIVDLMTKPEDMPKEEYIATFAEMDLDVVVVKAADRICNSCDYLNSGDAKYANKYLNIKGAPIRAGLEKWMVDGRNEENELAFNLISQWHTLQRDIIDTMLEN